MGERDLKSNRTEFTKFSEHFERSIEPSLLALEGERKKRFTIGIILGIAFLAVGLFLSWEIIKVAEDSRRSGRAYLAAIILPITLPMLGFGLPLFKLRKKTKLHLTKGISKFLGWQHSRPKNISKDNVSKALAKILYEFGAFPKHHFVQTDDILHGLHEHWAFALRELTVSRKRPLSRSGPVVVFRGLVLSFGVEERMQGEAIITRTRVSGHPHKRPAIKHEGVIEYPDGRIIIRASNERIIRTLLCPRFKSALIELDAKMPQRDLSCVLYNNELLIPIKNNNLFEVDWLADSMDSKIRVQKMLDDFTHVLELLDIFLKPRRCNRTGETKVAEFRYSHH